MVIPFVLVSGDAICINIGGNVICIYMRFPAAGLRVAFFAPGVGLV